MAILTLLLLQDDPAFRRADAMVDQLARSARLFTAHHGKLPESIDALMAAGFLPVEEAPKDPWRGAVRFAIAGEALEIKIEHGTRNVSVAVTKKQVQPRQLVPAERLAEMAAGAAIAYRTIHGKPPADPAALTAEPALLLSPKKTAGIKFRIASYATAVSVPTTPIEPLSPATREALAGHLKNLGAEDSAVRDRASEAIRAVGPGALEMIRAARKTTKDPEVSARLQELDGLLAAQKARVEQPLEVVAYANPGGTIASNERNASACLKSCVTAQEDFRANDLDRNNINDYWTGDLSGLYCMQVKATESVVAALNDIGLASADAAPLKIEFENAQVRYNAKLLTVESGIPKPRHGYLFRTMLKDMRGEDYAQDVGDAGPAVHNFGNFGFVAYPAIYGVTGRHTFIINEGASVFGRDTGGAPVLNFPTAAELSTHWRKVE